MGKRIAVIGGGASGLMTAIVAARNGAEVTIYEGKERLGKKLLATGNGKCNYTNLHQEDACFRGTHPEFSKSVRKQFDVNATLKFFKEIGILPKVKNGYVYPNSEQAASVADALAMEVRALRVSVIHEEAEKIQKKNTGYEIISSGATKQYDRIVLCMGSCAGMKDEKKFLGYQLVKSLGHTIEPVFPALVQMRCPEKWFKTISGVRCEGSIRMFVDGKEIAKESGELLFAEYGLSGIPVFQMSRFAGRALDNDRKVTCSIDFFDSMTVEQLVEHLLERFRHAKGRTAEEMLVGLLNHKLNYVILKECGIQPTEPAGKEFKSEAVFLRLAKKYKNFACQVNALNPFASAQVCAGGVNTEELNRETLESKKNKGLYFAGELIDVDGSCGGYNLQWAWSSGYVAGLHAATDKE